jgi:hypothetical protein
MADTAAHLVDCVLPEVPVRQWVLTLPYPLRYRCAYDVKLTSQVLRAFVRTLFAALRRRARSRWGVPRGQCGAVSFLQRFGSALNLNLHFHTLALDGVYPGDAAAPSPFVSLPPPSAAEVARVLAGTARRIARLLESRADTDDDALARDEPLLAALAAASLRTRIATGPNAGQRWRRLGDHVEPKDVDGEPESSDRVPQHAGMSLHADVAVPARDRQRLERLCRYVARPPLAHDRLAARPDGRLALRLKTRWRDGTTHILMERHELLDRLAPLIPPPRAHQIRYHGVLAPCASARDRIVPGPRVFPICAGRDAIAPRADAAHAREGVCTGVPECQGHTDGDSSPGGPSSQTREERLASELASEAAPPIEPEPLAVDPARPHPDAAMDRHGPRRLPWAALLQRVFELDALRCPRCGTSMRMVSAFEDPAVARKILEHLALPARAPPLAPAADTPAWYDSEAGYDDVAWAFDQTPPEDDGVA